MGRVLTVAAAAAAALGFGLSPAIVEGQPLATVTANVPIAAERGWVVWSSPGQGGWLLEAWHRGTLATLPAAPRPEPFDLDLGTDARGRTVVTFSRCTQTPRTTFDGRLASWSGAGCRVHVFDLATGREHEAGVRATAHSSDTTPSAWRGRIAFARTDSRHPDLARIKLWSPRTRRSRTLRSGGVPSGCGRRFPCGDPVFRDGIESIDLGARLVTFLRWVEGQAVYGHGAWEVRAGRVGGGRSVLSGGGFLGEACTEGADKLVPSAPAADGRYVWFSRLSSTCYRNTASLVRFDALRRRGRSGYLVGEVLQFAKDGRALYALVAPKPIGEVFPSCDVSDRPCTIERLDRPALTRPLRHPASYFSRL